MYCVLQYMTIFFSKFGVCVML